MDTPPAETRPPSYTNSQGQKLPPDYWRRQHRWPLLVSAILIVLIIVGVIYWLWLHPKKPAPAKATQATVQAQSSVSQTTEPTKTFNSTDFNLTFDYPNTWTVTDSNTGAYPVLTAKSPSMRLKNAVGQTVDGEVLMTIVDQGQGLNAFASGSATAVTNSQKIAYSKPTQNQRANTYLTFAQYASTTATGALDAVYITGDYGYQKGQDIPKTDIANIDPLVSITFLQCLNANCSSGTKTMNIQSSSWASFSSPIVKMLESLAFN